MKYCLILSMLILGCGNPQDNRSNKHDITNSNTDASTQGCDGITITGDNNTVNCDHLIDNVCSADVTVDSGGSSFSVGNCVGTTGGTIEGVCPDGTFFIVTSFQCGDTLIDPCIGALSNTADVVLSCDDGSTKIKTVVMNT